MAASLEDLSKTLTEMQSNLVCQVCEDRARPEKKLWYRCLKLHQICQDCRGKREKCTCGQQMSTEYCKMTEKLLSNRSLKFNCVNAKNGCNVTLAEDGLKDHESECFFRLVPCPYPFSDSCKVKKVMFRDVIQHYEKDHNKIEEKNISENIGSAFSNTGASGEDAYFELEKFCISNQVFLLNGKTQSLINYLWLQLLGSPNEAKHFSYSLKFISQKATNTFEGKVAAIDESFDSLSKAGKCFVIPHEFFMAQFVDEKLEYEYSLEIRNLKEEVKDEKTTNPEFPMTTKIQKRFKIPVKN